MESNCDVQPYTSCYEELLQQQQEFEAQQQEFEDRQAVRTMGVVGTILGEAKCFKVNDSIGYNPRLQRGTLSIRVGRKSFNYNQLCAITKKLFVNVPFITFRTHKDYEIQILYYSTDQTICFVSILHTFHV